MSVAPTTPEQRRSFIQAQTVLAAPPLTPEIKLHLATEITPIWEATEATLEANNLPPPYWAFAWPGGQALTRFLLDNADRVRGKRVLDFAAGSGLSAIGAKMAGAERVNANEIDDFAIEGNVIGTDWSGMRPLPNGFSEPSAAAYGGGIQIQSGPAQGGAYPIGGFGEGEANLIAYNLGSGISAAGFANAYFDNRGNAVHHNRGVGFANVDTGNAGPTPNDAGDADGGANNGQNSPEIVSAAQVGNQFSVTYRVDTAAANAAYPLRIDFHENVRGGSGALLAQDTYPQDAAQAERSVVFTLPPGIVAIPFVATATDANGYSSELSPAFDVIFEDDFDD